MGNTTEPDRMKQAQRAIRVVLLAARAAQGEEGTRRAADPGPKPEDLAAAREALKKIDGNEAVLLMQRGAIVYASLLFS